MQLLTERLTGIPCDYAYENAAMKWGHDQEPFARILYAERMKKVVRQVGFIPHPTIEMSGASPDGLIDTEGLLEIKCPQSFTHVNYILDGVVPDQYKPQMIWQMICTGRIWCDFVSYDPRMPERLRLFVIRFHLKDVAAQKLEEIITGVISLNFEVNDVLSLLNAYEMKTPT